MDVTTRRAGADRRGGRRRRGDGARARARRHPPRRRRRADGEPEVIKEIQEAVTIPVMAKARIGHFAEAQVLAVARGRLHRRVRGPDPGRRGQPHRQARLRGPVRLRRDQPRRGAAADRRGRGDDPLQGRGRDRQHRRGRAPPARDRRRHQAARARCRARSCRRPPRSCGRRSTSSREVAETGWLPVPLFCAGGIATPADAALTMQLGAEGNFVGSGIFKSEDPERARPRDRRGDDPLRRPRARRGRLDRARRADARRRHRRARRSGRAAPAPRGLAGLAGRRPPTGSGSRPRCASASSPARATSRPTRGCCASLGAEAVEVRTPEQLRRARRARDPRRRVDDDHEGDRARRPRAGDPRATPSAGRPILGTCAGMIVCDRDHLGLLDATARRNAFGRQLASFEADLEIDGHRPRAAARGLHPRALDRGARARGSRSSPSRRPSGRGPRGPASSPARSTPS